MNQKNVAALDALIEAYNDGEVAMELAEFLASRGVLVPSVLTLTDVGRLFDVPETEAFRSARVDSLARIARGEG